MKINIQGVIIVPSEAQKQDVIQALTNLGYINPEYNSIFGFDWVSPAMGNYQAALEYNKFEEQFVIKTVSSHWSVERAETFMKELAKAIDDAKTLNLILKRAK